MKKQADILPKCKTVYADFIGYDDIFRVKISKATAREMLRSNAGFTSIALDTNKKGSSARLIIAAN